MSAERRPETDATRRQVLGAGLAGTGICRCPRSWSRAPRWLRPRPTARPRWRDSWPRGVSVDPQVGQGTRPRVSTATSAVATRSTRGRCRTRAERHAGPEGALGDWLSPTFVTRAKVDGRTATSPSSPTRTASSTRATTRPAAARTPDGLHHPEASADQPDRAQPLPAGARRTRRTAAPRQLGRGAGPRRRCDQALTGGGPRRSGCGADHLSPEMNFATTKLFFAPSPKGLYNRALGPDAGVAVRAIHNRPKWNSEHPSIEQHFGSNSTLLYSYRDFELADTILLSGPTATSPAPCSTTACSRGPTGRS